jgi:hypothetical protein
LKAEDRAIVTIVDDGLPLEGKLGLVTMDPEIFLAFHRISAADTITSIQSEPPDRASCCPVVMLPMSLTHDTFSSIVSVSLERGEGGVFEIKHHYAEREKIEPDQEVDIHAAQIHGD